ncbi:TPA: 2-(3-amino-3-carboxypropyl)histidine synthase [Candidatus Woesearchaeota archaeon]|nr:Diphthamide biosynthesis enzyme Dph2 [archaeon GW2011_AR15]MBS3104134.1 diphthamide synthesis protein [Candidatus Woesearchaeota archaeon]HIH41414.1 2-(3-amino-3-carboxypropyl)histidine synthase [Candidatus Woesearchaeota archaeon]
MKFLFIEAKYDGIIKVPKSVIEKLPQTIGLFFTVQFIDSLESIKKDIEKTGRTVKLLKGKHTKQPGQIYGCNLEKFDGVDAFLYVGDGLFHPKALVLGNEQHVHIWNPVDKKYSVVTKSLMEKEVKRQKAAYSSFLMKENIGVLVSTKSGQSYLQQALKLKEKYPEKNFYYIAFDTIEFDKLEDFPFVDVWVNTACPRIGWDDTKRTAKPMVDLGTVL